MRKKSTKNELVSFNVNLSCTSGNEVIRHTSQEPMHLHTFFTEFNMHYSIP